MKTMTRTDRLPILNKSVTIQQYVIHRKETLDVLSKFVLQHVWHLQSLRQLVDLLILSNPLLCRSFRFLELLYLTYGTRKLVNQVEDFIGEIWSLPDELKENNRLS